MDMINYEAVQSKIVTVRNERVIDSDVAESYGVETKSINEAVKNNPEKFPQGYLLEVSENEKHELVENFDRL